MCASRQLLILEARVLYFSFYGIIELMDNPYDIAFNDPEFTKKLLLTVNDLNARLNTLEKEKPKNISLADMFSKIVGQIHSENYSFKAVGNKENFIHEFHTELEKLIKKYEIILLQGEYHI